MKTTGGAAMGAGMLAAAQLYRRRGVRCAKLVHDRGGRCVFRCGSVRGGWPRSGRLAASGSGPGPGGSGAGAPETA